MSNANSISEKDWLPKFLSEFHKNHLKHLGFRKVKRTFSREMDSYWERFNFQGSDSNGINGWWFYLNIGIEFKDLPPEIYWSGFPHTHWTTRIETLVPKSPKVWKYTIATDKKELAEELLESINIASQVLGKNAKEIHEKSLRKLKERNF